MYPISNEAFALFHDRETHHVQMAEITCETVNDTIVITDEDIRSGGLSINRYCSVGGSIGIGSAVAAELMLSLDNSDGKFNGVIFEGADMHVVIKIRDVTVEESPIYSIPMGYFTVDEAPRMLETINLVALDRMVLLDKAVDKDLLVFPSSIGNLLFQVCGICNLSTSVQFDYQPNGSYMVTVAPESDDLTYRQIVSWIAELTGRCAYINHDGRLQFEFYDTGQLQPVTEIGLADRFSSDLAENAITISGVQIVSDEDNKYLAGDEEYAFSIEGNELIRNGEQSVADALFAKLGGFTYTPFSAVIHSSPHLHPTDPVVFIDKDENEHFSLITEVTFALNRNTSIASVGESALRKGWAATNPLTKRESLIIRSAFAEQNKRLDDRTQAIIAMNELISNSAGLYNTSIEQEDGSFLHYMHDRPYLEDSLTIYTQTASGYAWTNNGWNDGAPVWQYGFEKQGNMIMNAISAYKIEADLVVLESESLPQVLTSLETEAKSYTDDKLSDYAEAVTGDLTDLQNQIDGSITNWFLEGVPTAATAPAKDWTTTEQKNIHLGDIYYDLVTGYAYRWHVKNNQYSWARLTDSDVTKAIADAAAAQDTADGKRRVFGVTPYPPYDVNDLWVQGSTGDILRCTKARGESGSYVASDWAKASKYTDDTIANANLATAKAYAETKATEAKTAAESYAKTKAEAERVLAEAYADGIVTAEEQARIDQAATNLADAKAHADTKAAAAESAAKSYADTAMVAAETAAKSYADAQLALEVTRADAYADGILDEAELIAIAQAEAKRDEAKLYAEQKASAAETAAKTHANNTAAAAEAAAKAYAEAQDLLEQERADAYADGIVDAEETARIDQAAQNLADAKAHADTKAAAAEEAAKTYAATQAANAKTAAETAANSYADAQLALEITRADAYADGIVSAEEAERIAQDTATLNAAKADADQKATAAENAAKAYADTTKTAAETAAKDYADAQDALNLVEAEAYADGAVSLEEQARIAEAAANLAAAKADATAKATAAENAAKGYADTTQTAAETAAKNYADAQDALRKAEAAAYADGIVDDEEQARIDQAAANLAAAKSHADTKAATAEDAAKTYAEAQAAAAEAAAKAHADGLNNSLSAIVTTNTNQITSLGTTITERTTVGGEPVAEVVTELMAGELIIRDTIRNGGHNILKNPRFGAIELPDAGHWYSGGTVAGYIDWYGYLTVNEFLSLYGSMTVDGFLTTSEMGALG